MPRRNPLTTSQKAVLRKSSREAIRDGCRRLRRYISRGQWIGTYNRYRENCVKALKPRPGSSRPSIDHRHLSDYIAASGPLHCVDGWSFLGRAVDCHVRGDPDAARHMAYYAELRGAMSLLSCEGVGVFNQRHYVIDSSLKCQELKRGGTHDVVWLSLRHWSGLQRSSSLLGRIVEPAGVPLVEWLADFAGAAATWRPMGRQWLRSWGLDLKRLSEDQDARNEASYRPTQMTVGSFLNAVESRAFIHGLWTLCEPYSSSPFELLDRHLLRISIEQAFEAVTGKRPVQDTSEFAERVEAMLGAVQPMGLPLEEWKRFLTRDIHAEDPVLIEEAGGTVTMKDPRHHLQVMARAALLLRVATGACELQLRSAEFGRDELEFWWKGFGEQRGLWDAGSEPDDLLDLWADVGDALQDMEEWEGAQTGPAASRHQWRRGCSEQLSVLGECERIVIWGLGL